MDKYSKAEIRKIVEEEGVEFIRLQFTDMFGMLKNIAVPARRLIKAMENCCTIDLASLEDFPDGRRGTVSEAGYGYLRDSPLEPQNGKVARFICDVCMEDGTEYEISPRLVLKKVLDNAAQKATVFG